MKHYQNTLTGEVVSEDEYSYAAAQKGNWVLYSKIPRYTIETPPYAPGRAEFNEDGDLCYWDDVKDRVNDLEKALRDVLRQLEKAINGNAMDGDWIAAELHGRECLYSKTGGRNEEEK